MIRVLGFTAWSLLCAFVGYGFAALHITDAMSAWDDSHRVERRIREYGGSNVTTLTPREHIRLRALMGSIAGTATSSGDVPWFLRVNPDEAGA